MPKIETERLFVEFDDATGAITTLTDKSRKLEFLDQDATAVPFRIHVEDGEGILEGHQSFSWQSERAAPSGSLTLRWKVRRGVQIRATVKALELGDGLEFHAVVENRSRTRIVGLEFPVLAALRPLSPDGMGDYLAHSYATGHLIHNPSRNFTAQMPGARYMPYPEGFSGCTAQFMAYYTNAGGGLYMACHDGEFAGKWLNFYRTDAGQIEASIIHGNDAVEPRTGFSTAYPTIVSFLDDGTWYEAADRYKEWAKEQQWCAKGWMADRPAEDRPADLFERVGATTFGIEARYDRSLWIKRYQETVDSPLLHILGPDWPKVAWGYRGAKSVAGELTEWFPAEFSAENMAAIRDHGDLVTPFEFDYLFPPDKAKGREQIRNAFQKFPKNKRSVDAYRFPFLCPTEPYSHALHVERDSQLLRDNDVDGLYYDISANNILRACTNRRHNHPRGAASELTRAYRKNISDTRHSMNISAGRYALIGTEMINEVFVDLLDFYQARAGAQPAAAFEGGGLRNLLKAGEVELIPLFAYLYHEYGPVRLDGWGKLSREVGDLFYYNAARIYLWGGLFEINSEFSPMEAIDGTENPVDEHYAKIVPRGYEFAEEMARYIGKWARLRTGGGKPYLAYGRMLRPPVLQAAGDAAATGGQVSAAGVPAVELSWFSYNCPAEWGEYEDRGTLSVPAVICSGWQARDGRVALFFCNVSEETLRVRAELDPGVYGEHAGNVNVELSPRTPVMVELGHEDG